MTYPTQYFPGLKSVRLLTICNDPNHSRTATGFIILEDGIPYLYTCWHVFTGQKDISDVSTFPHSPPREIVVQTKQVEARDPGVSVWGARHVTAFRYIIEEGRAGCSRKPTGRMKSGTNARCMFQPFSMWSSCPSTCQTKFWFALD